MDKTRKNNKAQAVRCLKNRPEKEKTLNRFIKNKLLLSW